MLCSARWFFFPKVGQPTKSKTGINGRDEWETENENENGKSLKYDQEDMNEVIEARLDVLVERAK